MMMTITSRRNVYIKRKAFLSACLALEEINVVRVCENWLMISTDTEERIALTRNGVHFRELPPEEEPLCR